MAHEHDHMIYLSDVDWELLEVLRKKHDLRSKSAVIAWLITSQYAPQPAPREVPVKVDYSSLYDPQKKSPR